MKFSDPDVALQHQLRGLDNSAYVQQLYLRVLGRVADPDGWKSYVEKLEASLPREEVYLALANSEEGVRYANRRAALRQQQCVVLTSMPTAVSIASTLVVEHVSELVALNGAAFVATVYRVLLNREVDPDGARTYLGLLRAGWSKTHVLTVLAKSAEARSVGCVLPGLKQVTHNYAKAERRSWGGWYCRNILGMESDLPADRERRALFFHIVLSDGV